MPGYDDFLVSFERQGLRTYRSTLGPSLVTKLRHVHSPV